MTAIAVPLRFQVGARTLASVPRRLVRVALSLDDVLADRAPVLPPLPAGAHGYLVTSVPERQASAVAAAAGLLTMTRQRYTRYHVDLTMGFNAWQAQLSANARAGLRRKARKLAAANGGVLEVERFACAAAMPHFHAAARQVSAKTYQERLMDAGLPDTPAFRAEMAARARTGTMRAWLLRVGETPIAYLYCPAAGSTLIYDRVGHDPAYGELSPGAVLQVEALRDLMEEGRFRRFDFTEGEGQHKRQMASGGTACVDLLLLRPTPANRLALLALAAFDGAMARARRLGDHPALRGLAKRLRRG